MTRETKIGLLLILVLVGAFSFVVYKKMQNQDEFPDADELVKSDQTSEQKRKAELIPPYRDGGAVTVETKTGNPKSSRLASRQGEPPIEQHGNGPTPPGGNPFRTASSTRNGDGSRTTIDDPRGKVRLGGGFPSSQNEPRGGDPFGSGTGDSGTVGSSTGGSSTGGSGTTTTGGSKTAGSWDLSGGEKTTTSRDGSATTRDNPFGTGTTTEPGDGFRTAGKTSATGGPFGSQHTSSETQTGRDAPRGIFGGNYGPNGSTTANPRDSGSDTRLGPYYVGTNRQRQSGSTTTVQTIGSDIDEPFGKSYDLRRRDGGTTPNYGGFSTRNLRDGRATTTDNGTTFPRKQTVYGSRTPTPIDGRDIHYANDRPRIHVVAYGDNYWTISRSAYGTGRYYIVLAEYNRHRIPNPKRMQPGMKVLIPKIGVLESRYPKICPRRAGKLTGAGQRNRLPDGFFRDRTGSPMFRIGKTDTLSEIAQKHLGRSSRWIQIYHLNRNRIPNPNRLKIGTELRLPADASSIRVVRTRGSYR